VAVRTLLFDSGRRPWLGSAHSPRLAAGATVVAVTLATTLTDTFANAGLLMPMTAFLALLAVVGAAVLRWPRFGLPDVGLALLVLAGLWPRLAHLEPGAPGALLFIVTTYAIGRFSGLTPRHLALLLVGVGAVMGAIAIAQTLPSLSKLVAILPIREGLPVRGTRATGLLNNPNTFATYEAMIVVLAAVVGLPWRFRTNGRAALAGSVLLFCAVALCIAGVGVSASRESVLGLIAGMAACALVPRDGWRRRLFYMRPYLGAAIVAVVVVVVVAAVATSGSRPNITGRFDPTTVTTDHNLLDRMASWRLAVDYIGHAPLLGYGASLPMRSVDNVYLEWILSGGVVGLVIWLAAAALVAPRRAWPLLAAILVIGCFANPFAVGPGLAILLIACGALASQPIADAAAASEPDPEAAPAAPATS
jgi:O-antigen ligase